MRSLRFALEHAIEDVDNQVALLHSKVATLDSPEDNSGAGRIDYDRVVPLVQAGAITKEEVDHRHQALLVAKAKWKKRCRASTRSA